LAFARRIVTESASAEPTARIHYAFRLCLARNPRDVEMKTLQALYEAQRATGRRDPKAVQQLLAGVPLPPGVTAEELAAWYAVAAALLNLDETITKG
jgi:hypothetical protein